MTWGFNDQIVHLEKLLTPGLIGTYGSFEITEIFGFERDGPPTNILTLLVAEPEEPPSVNSPGPGFLNDKPIPLTSTKWKLGIARSRIAPSQLVDALRRLGETAEWKIGASALKVGRLTAIPPQFVPSDTFQTHAWNGVLKNNFFDGSHVLELFDREKLALQFLFDRPKLLTELAKLIRPYAPVGLDGLSDRLGNVLIQLPVTATVTKFGRNQADGFALEPLWHPAVPPRPLRVSWEVYEDATIEDFTSAAVGIQSTSQTAKFPLHSKRMGARYVIWDDINRLIVGASAQTAFLGGDISVTSRVLIPATREFLEPTTSAEQCQPTKQAVVIEPAPDNPDRPHPNPREPWRSARVFRESLHALQSRKEFVQYGGPSGAGRAEALADIRWLLRQHGTNGAWLWDPFLSADDVLHTLFFCPWRDADLRALSSASTPPRARAQIGNESDCAGTTTRGALIPSAQAPASPSWKEEQVSLIEQSKGNGEGLKLEFRVRIGSAGWSFHDRFLIFPRASAGAVAWSLGTSVNSLGRQHHILQQVSDGELIRQAFLELWDALGSPEHLVWKTP